MCVSHPDKFAAVSLSIMPSNDTHHPTRISEAREQDISWDRLLRYYSLCVEHEGAFEELLTRSAAKSTYVFVKQSQEELVSGISAELSLAAEMLLLVQTAMVKGEALYYGYPTVVATEETPTEGGRSQRRRKIGALFLVEIALPSADERIPDQLTVKSDLPFLHPGILSRYGFRQEQLVKLVESAPVEPHLNSHSGMRQYLSELCSDIGIPTIEDVDPAALRYADEGRIDGDGIHNVAVLFRAPSSQYNQGLISELRELRSRWSEAKETAAGLLLGASDHDVSSRNSKATVAIAAPLPINEAQENALMHAMRDRLTVVTGPPGTGKSQLITNAVATACVAQQSVLVASTNNQAVSVVCDRANKLWPGLIIRTGSRAFRDAARDSLSNLLKTQATIPDLRTLRMSLEKSWRHIIELRGLVRARTDAETRLGEVHLGREVLAHDLGWNLDAPPATLAGRGLQRRLRQARRLLGAWFLRDWRIARFFRAMNLQNEGLLPLVERLLTLEVEWRSLLTQIPKFMPMDVMSRDLLVAQESFRLASERLVHAVGLDAVRSGRTAISKFLQTRYRFGEENPVAANFLPVLNHLRAWATTSLSVRANMPLKPGLFDLVIIDEASQCAIPAIIPLLFRAKRALIIGDPMQLAHISTLSKSGENSRLESSGLDRRVVDSHQLSFQRHSIYHALERRTPSVHLLDEHYRCHPQIIELSNQLFYGGRLTVLTNPGQLIDFGTQAVAWRDVSGRARRPDSGSAVNELEASAVVDELRRLLARDSFRGSIGVVTPFSAQARLIERIAADIPEATRTARQLSIGTAHRFQGDERDIIIFSPVASQGIAESSLGWLVGTANLFNVAVTRARSYFLVVGDRGYCENNAGVLGELARYVGKIETEAKVEHTGMAGDLHSEAEVRLYRALVEAGLKVSPKTVVGGYECDFVIEHGGSVINIECDGRTHLDDLGRLRRQDRARDQLVQAKGWQVVRIPAWRCLMEPEVVAREFCKSAESLRGVSRSAEYFPPSGH